MLELVESVAKSAGMPVADVQRLDSVQSELKEVEKFFAEGSLNKFVRPPRWPYDMRPSARAEMYIRDAGP